MATAYDGTAVLRRVSDVVGLVQLCRHSKQQQNRLKLGFILQVNLADTCEGLVS
jgi:hypothetical protein